MARKTKHLPGTVYIMLARKELPCFQLKYTARIVIWSYVVVVQKLGILKVTTFRRQQLFKIFSPDNFPMPNATQVFNMFFIFLLFVFVCIRCLIFL